MHLPYIPQYTIQNRNMYISVPNDVLREGYGADALQDLWDWSVVANSEDSFATPVWYMHGTTIFIYQCRSFRISLHCEWSGKLLGNNRLMTTIFSIWQVALWPIGFALKTQKEYRGFQTKYRSGTKLTTLHTVCVPVNIWLQIPRQTYKQTITHKLHNFPTFYNHPWNPKNNRKF